MRRRYRVSRSRARRARQDQHVPVGSIAVTLGVIGLGFLVLNGDARDDWYQHFGLVPSRFWAELAAADRFWEAAHWYTPLTSTFVHVDWLHLLGNLAFFWLFAQRIERRTGWPWLLALVAGGGALSTLVTAAQFETSSAPIIGASGATAAMLGAFLMLYPTARIGVVLPLGLYFQLIRVPGLLLIGTWFLIQIFFSIADRGGAGGPAIAWWSHSAGLAAGLILAGAGRILGLLRR